MANKTIYLPITAPDDLLEDYLLTFAKSVGWTPDNVLGPVDYSASYIRRLLRNNISQQKAKDAAEVAAQEAAESVHQVLDAIEQEPISEGE